MQYVTRVLAGARVYEYIKNKNKNMENYNIKLRGIRKIINTSKLFKFCSYSSINFVKKPTLEVKRVEQKSY
jgi:hypothetical protein